jgi:hypothetical protein
MCPEDADVTLQLPICAKKAPDGEADIFVAETLVASAVLELVLLLIVTVVLAIESVGAALISGLNGIEISMLVAEL